MIIGTMFLIFILWACFLAFLFFLSFTKVRQNQDRVVYIFSWAFPFGAFVWEDLLIFSLTYFVFTLITLVFQDFRLWLLFMIVFWIVRAAGETLYYFLEQFNQPAPYPHNHSARFHIIKNVFGNFSNQQCFIIMQICFQAVLIFFITALILLLQNWETISPTF